MMYSWPVTAFQFTKKETFNFVSLYFLYIFITLDVYTWKGGILWSFI